MKNFRLAMKIPCKHPHGPHSIHQAKYLSFGSQVHISNLKMSLICRTHQTILENVDCLIKKTQRPHQQDELSQKCHENYLKIKRLFKMFHSAVKLLTGFIN